MPDTLVNPRIPIWGQEAIYYEELARDFAQFTKDAWLQVEPSTPLIWGWHLDAICEHLQAIAEREIRNLLINIPPRHCKSIATAVIYPAWVWLRQPATKFLFSSYAQNLSIRDSVRCRRLIENPWYQEGWEDAKIRLVRDQNQKIKFENTAGGYRMATSVDGSNTGEGGDMLMVDDPHNIRESESDVVRDGVLEWWDTVMSTRLNDPKTGCRVVIMQRVHEQDLSGHILEKAAGEWVHLKLPAEFEKDRRCVTVWAGHRWEDPRTKPHELLWPERFGPEEMAHLKKSLGSYAAAGQLQQEPAPLEGGILKKEFWKFWQPVGEKLPPVLIRLPGGVIKSVVPEDRPIYFEQELLSWDCSFKDSIGADYVVGQHWGKKGRKAYLNGQRRDRMDFVRTCTELKAQSAELGMPGKVLVEDAANGPAIINSLRAEVDGLIPVTALGSKLARASAYTSILEAGQCYLPHPSLAPWVWDFIHELSVFPNGPHDDQVDAWSQAMNKLYGKDKSLSPVFPEFTPRLHTSEQPMAPSRGLRGFRFWFGGVFPCCVIGQMGRKGGVYLLHSVQGENVGLEDFVRMRVLPVINQYYPWASEWMDVGPVGLSMRTSHDLEGERPSECLERVLQTTFLPGIKDWESRKQAVKELMARHGGLVLNSEKTPGEAVNHHVLAMQEGYAYQLDKAGQIQKDRPHVETPSYAVGEAITQGISRMFAPPPQPYVPRGKPEKAQARAKSYAV